MSKYLTETGLAYFWSKLKGVFVSTSAQTLTEAQKAQVRANIGASGGGASDETLSGGAGTKILTIISPHTAIVSWD